MSAPAPAWAEGLAVRALTADDRDALRACITREAVVPILSPADLARRLAEDRRILSVEDGVGAPLAFVHTALTPTFPTSLHDILAAATDERTPRCATFYGITRVDDRARGEAGRLLAAALDHIAETVPTVQRFATLSPLPGFRAWVERLLDLWGHPNATGQIEAIARLAGAGMTTARQDGALRRLARLYLQARDDRGRVRDPVARFHLGQGAQVRTVLVGADTSWRGLEASLGVMVSYQYAPLPVEEAGGDDADGSPLDVLLAGARVA